VLPATLDMPTSPSAGAGSSRRPDRAASALAILVVDDDPIEVRILRKHLSEAGYGVLIAGDGEQALEVVASEAPRLAVTDLMMPRMDGIALCKALRGSPAGRQMQVIMLTGCEEEESLVAALEAGADDYVIKPVRPRELLARVRAAHRTILLQDQLRRDKEELRRYAAELAFANRKLQEAALTDHLTGLPNRRCAMERLAQEWASSVRTSQLLACLFMDIDHFKQVNDRYGHDVGDQVIHETGVVLKAAARECDVVCRIGGEEFITICRETDLEGAARLAERARQELEKHSFGVPGFDGEVTISAGVAVRESSMCRPGDLLNAADAAVYAAKRAGRNCVKLAPMGISSLPSDR
jgi:two-component system, cell cycle response regulator